jgi:hypothetical protein
VVNILAFVDEPPWHINAVIIAVFSSQVISFSSNADRAPQLKASVVTMQRIQ